MTRSNHPQHQYWVIQPYCATIFARHARVLTVTSVITLRRSSAAGLRLQASGRVSCIDLCVFSMKQLISASNNTLTLVPYSHNAGDSGCVRQHVSQAGGGVEAWSLPGSTCSRPGWGSVEKHREAPVCLRRSTQQLTVSDKQETQRSTAQLLHNRTSLILAMT